MRYLLFLLLTAVCLAQGLYTETREEGVVGVQLDPKQPNTVLKLLPGGPGEKAGIKVGDLVLSIDGVSVVGKDLTQTLALCRRPAGTKAPVVIETKGQKHTVEVTWEAIPPAALAQLEAELKAKKSTVQGVVEKQQGQAIGILLEMPVGRAFAPGALVGIMPDSTVTGQAKLTRIVTPFRVEAELQPGSTVKLWDRVVVTP